MTITVSELNENDREQWEKLYYAYADFYNMPMDAAILETIWSWIFDNNNRGRASYDKIAEKTHWLTYQMPVA